FSTANNTSTGLTVTRFAFTDQVGNDSQTYGSPANFPSDLGTTINTGVNGENLAITYSSTGDTATAHVLGSPYDITGALANGTGLTSDYQVTLNPGTLTVTRPAPVITWATPGPVAFGTPLSTKQLAATANVPGSFVYTTLVRGALTPVAIGTLL